MSADGVLFDEDAVCRNLPLVRASRSEGRLPMLICQGLVDLVCPRCRDRFKTAIRQFDQNIEERVSAPGASENTE